MREMEVKFRFWSKILDNFVIPDDSIYRGTFKDPEMVCMQYTGLKDKNGVEIYEGDIIKASMNKNFNIERNLTDEVVSQPGAFTVGHGNFATLLVYCRDDIEIDGNIYENPELLK